jgi:hypothetical protein
MNLKNASTVVVDFQKLAKEATEIKNWGNTKFHEVYARINNYRLSTFYWSIEKLPRKEKDELGSKMETALKNIIERLIEVATAFSVLTPDLKNKGTCDFIETGKTSLISLNEILAILNQDIANHKEAPKLVEASEMVDLDNEELVTFNDEEMAQVLGSYKGKEKDDKDFIEVTRKRAERKAKKLARINDLKSKRIEVEGLSFKIDDLALKDVDQNDSFGFSFEVKHDMPLPRYIYIPAESAPYIDNEKVDFRKVDLKNRSKVNWVQLIPERFVLVDDLGMVDIAAFNSAGHLPKSVLNKLLSTIEQEEGILSYRSKEQVLEVHGQNEINLAKALYYWSSLENFVIEHNLFGNAKYFLSWCNKLAAISSHIAVDIPIKTLYSNIKSRVLKEEADKIKTSLNQLAKALNMGMMACWRKGETKPELVKRCSKSVKHFWRELAETYTEIWLIQNESFEVRTGTSKLERKLKSFKEKTLGDINLKKFTTPLVTYSQALKTEAAKLNEKAQIRSDYTGEFPFTVKCRFFLTEIKNRITGVPTVFKGTVFSLLRKTKGVIAYPFKKVGGFLWNKVLYKDVVIKSTDGSIESLQKFRNPFKPLLRAINWFKVLVLSSHDEADFGEPENMPFNPITLVDNRTSSGEGEIVFEYDGLPSNNTTSK